MLHNVLLKVKMASNVVSDVGDAAGKPTTRTQACLGTSDAIISLNNNIRPIIIIINVLKCLNRIKSS